MSARLEKLAKDLAAHGYKEVAEMTSHLAVFAEKRGVPAYLTPKEIKVNENLEKIIEALSLFQVNEVDNLNEELALHVNKLVGASLDDDTSLLDLLIPNIKRIDVFPKETRSNYEKIPIALRQSYNRAIQAAWIIGIEDLGTLRLIGPEISFSGRGLGPKSYKFLATAYKKRAD